MDGSYLGYDRRVHRAKGRVQYADFSAWDSYRAQDQLLAWLFPARYRDILLSLLDDYRRGGRLPRWGEKNLDAEVKWMKERAGSDDNSYVTALAANVLHLAGAGYVSCVAVA